MERHKHLIVSFILLLTSIIYFGVSDIDQTIEDHFFNFQTHQWILDRNLEPLKFIFYDGIKKLLIFVALVLLLALLFFKKNKIVQAYQRGIIIVVLLAIFIPLVVGGLKKSTHMPCPKNQIHYGGIYPKTAVWESYPRAFKEPPNIACWPAGHASGGFALLSLWFLFKRRRNQLFALMFALTVGWSMGMYKMLIGDHSLSHTVISMLLAWWLVLLIDKALPVSPSIKRESQTIQ